MQAFHRFFIMAILCLMAGPLYADQINVAAAANFTGAMRDIVPLFEESTGHRVRVSYGSTGKLYSQIEHGAPFDVYLAADSARPKRAEQEGLAVSGSRFTYARGKLALWSPEQKQVDDPRIFLAKSDFNRLAIANPRTAPYGLAAKQVLEKLELWSVLQRKIVRGDSIAQTFQFVATRNAEVGLVAVSQIKAWKHPGGVIWEIPKSYYSPIKQQAVLLKKGEQNLAAKAFLNFLKSETARMVITDYGYGVE